MSGSVFPVAFSYSGWASRYPEFANVPQATATAYFNEACLYLDNTGAGPVSDAGTQLVLLNMITAHISSLSARVSADLVGRITNASEGSVSTALEMAPARGQLEAWFNQTRYGAQFWAATAQYRRGFYIAAPQPYPGGGPFGALFPGWGWSN